LERELGPGDNQDLQFSAPEQSSSCSIAIKGHFENEVISSAALMKEARNPLNDDYGPDRTGSAEWGMRGGVSWNGGRESFAMFGPIAPPESPTAVLPMYLL